jgi:glycerol dehydrogenase
VSRKETFGIAPYGAECTEEEIERVTKIVKDNDCDTVIAIGRGKAMDIGKIVAKNTSSDAIMIPTSVATNATLSAVSVMSIIPLFPYLFRFNTNLCIFYTLPNSLSIIILK